MFVQLRKTVKKQFGSELTLWNKGMGAACAPVSSKYSFHENLSGLYPTGGFKGMLLTLQKPQGKMYFELACRQNASFERSSGKYQSISIIR
jgi:hypothetical protein